MTPHAAQDWFEFAFFQANSWVSLVPAKVLDDAEAGVWLLRKPLALPPIHIRGVLGELERCGLSLLTFFLPAAT